MSVEGVFRKNGNIRRLNTLAEALDRGDSQVDLTAENAVQIAALLKKFLRELPDPLLTFKLHRLFVMSQSKPSVTPPENHGPDTPHRSTRRRDETPDTSSDVLSATEVP